MATEESSPSPSTMEDPPLTNPQNYTIENALENIEQTTPLMEKAIEQALNFQKSAQQTLGFAIVATRSRLSEIRSTSSAHFQQSIESLKDVKGEYDVFEAKFFAKVKEGAIVAASYPFITTGAVVGLGFLGLKGPRRFLYYRSLRLFSSEEALLSRADAKVKELKQSFERLKAEAEKLERRASMAEEEMKRGRTKLRHAGHQIRKAVYDADKIEKQARGLKGILADLPKSEASRFNSQVKNLVSEAKQERKVLAKEVTKISDYGISI